MQGSIFRFHVSLSGCKQRWNTVRACTQTCPKNIETLLQLALPSYGFWVLLPFRLARLPCWNGGKKMVGTNASKYSTRSIDEQWKMHQKLVKTELVYKSERDWIIHKTNVWKQDVQLGRPSGNVQHLKPTSTVLAYLRFNKLQKVVT